MNEWQPCDCEDYLRRAMELGLEMRKMQTEEAREYFRQLIAVSEWLERRVSSSDETCSNARRSLRYP